MYAQSEEPLIWKRNTAKCRFLHFKRLVFAAEMCRILYNFSGLPVNNLSQWLWQGCNLWSISDKVTSRKRAFFGQSQSSYWSRNFVFGDAPNYQFYNLWWVWIIYTLNLNLIIIPVNNTVIIIPEFPFQICKWWILNWQTFKPACSMAPWNDKVDLSVSQLTLKCFNNCR